MGCYDNTDSPMSLFPEPPSPKCPSCGMVARVWPTPPCVDPFHAAAQVVKGADPIPRDCDPGMMGAS